MRYFDYLHLMGKPKTEEEIKKSQKIWDELVKTTKEHEVKIKGITDDNKSIR